MKIEEIEFLLRVGIITEKADKLFVIGVLEKEGFEVEE